MLDQKGKVDLIAKGLKEVYHGTFANFEDFDPNLLGSNTGARSATMGFFFATNIMVATSYASKIREQIAELLATRNRLKGEVVQQTNGEDYPLTVHKLVQKHFNKKESYSQDVWAKIEPIMEQVVDLDHELEKLSDTYFNDQIELAESGKIKKAFLKMDKPFVLDYEGTEITGGQSGLPTIIETAKKNGFDSVVIKSTLDGGDPCGHSELTDVYIVFDSNQILKEQRVYPFEEITVIMNDLEKQVFAEQAFIRANESRFDKDPEQGWSELKAEAEENLRVWDTLKAKRDIAKQKSKGLRIG